MDIIRIVKEGNFSLLRENLKFSDVNIRDEKKNTLLMLAVLNNSLEMARFLILNGASLDEVNTDGNTALHLAIMARYNALFKMLIRNGANIEIKNKQLETPLMLAMRMENIFAYRALLEFNANTSFENERNEGLLAYIIYANDIELLRANFSENDRMLTDVSGNNLLHLATRLSRWNMMSFLIEKKINPNYTNDAFETPLFIAVRHNDLEAIAILIKAYTITSTKNRFNETIFDIASAKIEEYINELTASPKYQRYLQSYPLHVAVLARNLELAKQRLSIINKNKKDDYGYLALDYARAINHPELIKLLK